MLRSLVGSEMCIRDRFSTDPTGSIDEIVTRDKLSVLDLARQVVAAVYAAGRQVLVVDCGEDGKPYIAQYNATSMYNWHTDLNGALTLAAFRETCAAPGRDEFSHETVDRYRVYTPGLCRVFDEEGKELERHVIAGTGLPVIPIGAVNCSARCDRAPVTRIVECALAAYRNSADYQQGIFLTAQPTAWSVGCSEDQFNKNTARGLGAGAHWYLGELAEGKVNYCLLYTSPSPRDS